MSSKFPHTGWIRPLLTYAVGCFVLLQLADILLQPLNLPDSLIRWLMLLMLGVAPLIVAVVTFSQFRRQQAVPAVEEAGESAVFLLAHAEVDTTTRQIRFNGVPAEVQPKVFDLIVYLLRARHRVVTKDELFDEIWPSVVVSEASLTQSIKRARDLFRQHGFEQEVIRTVSRKGYQFDYPIETLVAGHSQSTAPGKLALFVPTAAMAVIALALSLFILNTETGTPLVLEQSRADSSLAVLPFANLSPDPDFQYFSDGLTETITNSLTRVRGLRIIAQASVDNFRQEPVDFRRIGEQLNIRYVVQGSVQQEGGDLRIAARLIDTVDGSQRWSQIYNRESDDVFSLHDDIARAIVEQMSGILMASLNLPQNEVLIGNADDSEAYRLLLRGQSMRRQASNEDLESAERLFRQALQINPDYDEALVALADVIRVRAVTGTLPRESTFSEALTLARQALAVNPEAADALVQIGEIQHRHFWDFEGAAASYQQALAINPGSAAVHSAYSRFLAKAGAHDEAVVEARIALDLNPLASNAASSLIVRLIKAGELEAAREELVRFSDNFPEHYDIPWLQTNWHISNGSYGDALQWIALEELDYLRLSLSAVAMHAIGRTGQAQAALEELIATDADGAAFQIAEVYAQMNQADAAFNWLERAFEQGDPGLAELYSSLNLGNIETDPRFPELAAKIGLPAPMVSI